MKVSLIIPTMNESGAIRGVLNNIPRDIVDEVIIVDGYSTDGTVEIANQLGYKVIFQEGKGYGNAVKTGVKYASGDVVVLIDADEGYNLSDIPKLIGRLNEGYDIAYGSRYLPESGNDDDTWITFIGNKLFTFLLNKVQHVRLSDALFLYIAARKEVFDKINMKSTNFEYCIEFPIRAHKAGFRHCEIPSRENKRLTGKSKVNAFYDGLRILWAVLKG